MERDPVCGMLVDPKEAVAKREYQGKTYFFCSPNCVGKFDALPQRHVTAPSTPPNRAK